MISIIDYGKWPQHWYGTCLKCGTTFKADVWDIRDGLTDLGPLGVRSEMCCPLCDPLARDSFSRVLTYYPVTKEDAP